MRLFDLAPQKRMLRRAIVTCMAAGLLLGHSCSDITTTTLLCEDAASRLYACCTSHAAINCTENGCGEHHPNFATAIAKCVRSASCDDIRQAGLCEVPDWQFSIATVCHSGTATCSTDAGSTTCRPTITEACAALGRLKCQ